MSNVATQTETFMALFLANQRRFYGLIASLVPNANDADDLLQDTAASMWRKFDEFEPGTDFAAWGLRFARFAVLKFFERQRTRGVVVFDDALVGALCDEAAVARAEVDDRHDALRRCVAQLPERSRSLVELRYQPGATINTVALRVGLSVAAVYKALQRIHHALLKCVEQRLAAEGAR
jgi:RNA polymerase sigma-70 factor (ECF subfamily)